MLESPSFASAGALMDRVPVCACASTAAKPRNSGRQSRAENRPRRRRRAAARAPAAARAGEGAKLSEKEAGRRVSERPPADAEDSGREAERLRRRHHEDAGRAARRLGSARLGSARLNCSHVGASACQPRNRQPAHEQARCRRPDPRKHWSHRLSLRYRSGPERDPEKRAIMPQFRRQRNPPESPRDPINKTAHAHPQRQCQRLAENP